MDAHLGGEKLTSLRAKMGALIASGDAVTGTVCKRSDERGRDDRAP
jgi:hypothetical protein